MALNVAPNQVRRSQVTGGHVVLQDIDGDIFDREAVAIRHGEHGRHVGVVSGSCTPCQGREQAYRNGGDRHLGVVQQQQT